MTNETEVTAAPEPAVASRDREEVVEKAETENVEVVETVETAPEPRPDIEDVIEQRDDPRSEIYKRHTEKRESEIEQSQAEMFETGDEKEDSPGENEQIAVETDNSTAIIESEPEPTDTPPDSEKMATVKILGIDRQVPQSKIDAAGGVENYQIRIAAQEQMERNAHERAALEARQAALDERERRIAASMAEIPAMDSQSAANPTRSTPLDGQTLTEKARQYQEAVYDDADDAPSILAEMIQMAANTGQQFDENAFRQKVKEDVLAEQRQAKIVKASHALIEAHPELNQRDASYDPRMFEAIDSETVVVEREHQDWEPEQVVQEAYDRIRKWRGVPSTETMSEKQAQKRAMNRPKAANARYTPPPPPPRQTNSDYVQQERKRRGLE